MSAILKKAKNIYVNLRGFHTKRKLLVIESDDWGSIRMPSREVFDQLRNMGDCPEGDPFLSNDCLESEDDLGRLFDGLLSIRDGNGRCAVITANFATANPNFDRIDYENGVYAYEPFYETYGRYYPGSNILKTIMYGIKQGCFLPQLHCREHMNVNRWMKALKDKKPDATRAFICQTIGVGESFGDDNVYGYMDAFNTDLTTHEELGRILSDGVGIFKATFGYDSRTFVASCFVWDSKFEKLLFDQNICGIQTDAWQSVPVGRDGEYKLRRKLRYTGQRNKFGQIYTVRNCSYEPSIVGNVDTSVDLCLEEINTAFKHDKPAIVNSHRLNYIDSINPGNATRNIEGLNKILTEVIQRYPDVEFVTSVELLDIIMGARKNEKK